MWQLLAKPLLGVVTDSVKGFVQTKKLKSEVKIAQIEAEKQRNLDMFRQTMPLVDIAAETAAQRRLMEDRSSPTKISQQILRAKQGEAALMNAIANQASAGAQIGSLGTGRRFGK